jgi:hypothetical protein
MKRLLRALLSDKKMAREIAEHGLKTIHARHTCAHRADELMSILRKLDTPRARPAKNQNHAPENVKALNRQISSVATRSEQATATALARPSVNGADFSRRVLTAMEEVR